MSVSPVKPAPHAPYVEDCADDDDKETAQDEPSTDFDVPRPRPAAPPAARPRRSPPAANSARKVTRRDEASDSGYSSHTFATGSSSQSSSQRRVAADLKKGSGGGGGGGFFAKAFGMGKKSADKKEAAATDKAAEKAAKKEAEAAKKEAAAAEKATSPKAIRRPSLGRAPKKSDLRTAAAAAEAQKRKPRPAVTPLQTDIPVRTESARTAPVLAPRASPVVAHGPPQQLIAGPAPPRPDQRTSRVYAPPRPRPYSYHGGMAPSYAPLPGGGAPFYHLGPVLHPGPMMPPPQGYPPLYAWPQVVAQPSSPRTNHIINYSMSHTSPHGAYTSGPGIPPYGYYPPASRRVSMSAAAPHPGRDVHYPPVPASHQRRWQYGHHRGYTTGATYAPPMESPEEYEPVLEDEAFYRDPGPSRRSSAIIEGRTSSYNAIEHPREHAFYREIADRKERERLEMPPPPVPLRPGLGRSATTSTTRPLRTSIGSGSKRNSLDPQRPSPTSSKRYSQEPPTSQRPGVDPLGQPRETPFDETSRPASRPTPTVRNSQSSAEGAMATGAPGPPSPTLRRSSRGLSRPTSYLDAREIHHPEEPDTAVEQYQAADKYKDAEAYQERTGAPLTPAITTDSVQKALRQKPSTKRSATRSQSSRTSSKSSDPKKRHPASDTSRDRPRRPPSEASESKHRADRSTDAGDYYKRPTAAITEKPRGLKAAKMVLDAVRQHEDTEIRVKSRSGKERSVRYVPSGSSGRGGETEVARSSRSGKERSVRYVPSGSSGRGGDIEIARSSQRREDPRSRDVDTRSSRDSDTRSANGREVETRSASGRDGDARSSSRHRSRSRVRRRPAEDESELVERVRSKAESRSRRSSRSGTSVR